MAFAEMQLTASVGGKAMFNQSLEYHSGNDLLSKDEQVGLPSNGVFYDFDLVNTRNRFAAIGLTARISEQQNVGTAYVGSTSEIYEINNVYSRIFVGLLWRFSFREVEEYLGYFGSVALGYDELKVKRELESISEENLKLKVEMESGSPALELAGGAYLELYSWLDLVSECSLRAPFILEPMGDYWLEQGGKKGGGGSAGFDQRSWVWSVSIGLMWSL